jgi:hypothetical protein
MSCRYEVAPFLNYGTTECLGRYEGTLIVRILAMLMKPYYHNLL